MDFSPVPRDYFGSFGFCNFSLTTLSNLKGASILLYLDQRSLYYLTIPRNLQSSLTFLGGANASIACTLFGCGLILSLLSIYITPQFRTITVSKRGLPVLEFLTILTHNHMGTPHFEMGTVFLTSPQVMH